MDGSCNLPKTISADDNRNDKPKKEKNKKTIFVIGDNVIKGLNDGKSLRIWTQLAKCLLTLSEVRKQHAWTIT